MKKTLLSLLLLLLPLNAFALTVNTGGFDKDWKAVEQCIQEAIPDHKKLLKNARVDLFHSKIISPFSGEETEYFGVITLPGTDLAGFKAAFLVPGCTYDMLMWRMLFSIDSGTDRLIYLSSFNPVTKLYIKTSQIFESRGRKTIYMRDGVDDVFNDKTPRRTSATYSPPDYTRGISIRDHKNFVEFMKRINR